MNIQAKKIFFYIFIFFILSLFFCKAHAPADGTIEKKDGLIFGGKSTRWPVMLDRKLRYPGSSLLSLALTKDSKGAFILLNTKEQTSKIWKYYKDYFHNSKEKKWKVLLKNDRPSKKKDLLKKYPALAKKSGLDLEKYQAGNHYVIVAEGKTGLYVGRTIVSISILSFSDHSEIRQYFKPLPSISKQF